MKPTKEKIYLDLSNCTEEEIKETYKKIKNSDQNIHTLTKRDLINGIVTHCYWFLFFDGNAWNQNETPLSGRTELTYHEFINLFEGGESKEVLQVENKITYKNRYSDDENSDDMGRWSRKAFYKDLCIGWINKLETERGVFFSLSTFFPLTGNDSPTKHELHPTYEESRSSLEKLWFEFLKNINSNQ